MDRTATVILAFIENYDRDFLMHYVNNSSYIICADAGQSIAAANDIEPDCVIGDFDSTKEDVRFDCKYISYPVEKDITDAEACVLHCIDEGITDINFIGGIGGRLDHTLGALSLLIKFKDNLGRIRLIDKCNQIELLENGSIIIEKDPAYRFFSIVPVYEKISGVSICGAKYPLDNVEMKKASTLGISNEVIDDYAKVTINDGLAYIIRSSDK